MSKRSAPVKSQLARGWFGGGMITDAIDRITLSNDTVNAVDRCNLTAPTRGLSAIS